MWRLSLWAGSSLHRLVYQEDYEGSGGALICMSMNAIAMTSRNVAKTASIINPDGSTASAILSDVRINWRIRLSAEPLWKKSISRRKRWWGWVTYDYFYGQQAEMFAFYRVPKVLFTEDCFWNVSTATTTPAQSPRAWSSSWLIKGNKKKGKANPDGISGRLQE